ncbi:MAG TPA: hypothetical protein VN764_18495 [Polyangiaceae bacterium]|jgi:hypothetical protein|nr:hypothetical protein [Polyangiaceae bacterium]
MFGSIGAFLALSDALKASERGWEGFVYRIFFGLGACIMFGVAWRIWTRSVNSWRWLGIVLAVCALSAAIFHRIKVLEKKQPNEDVTSQEGIR